MPSARPGEVVATLRRSDRGTATAEFVVAVPALLAVIVLAVGAILLAAQQVRLTAVAAELARLEARGDAREAQRSLSALGSGAVATREREGGLHCVGLRAHPVGGALAAIGIGARSCAAIADPAPGSEAPR